MQKQVWKIICSSRHWSACINELYAFKPPIKDVPNGFVQFYPACGDYTIGCGTYGEVTISLRHCVDYYLAQRKDVNGRVPMRVRLFSKYSDKSGQLYCCHPKHTYTRNSMHRTHSELLKMDPRMADITDIKNGTVSNLSEVRDLNSRMVYNARAKEAKSKFKHELLPMSMHVSNIESVYKSKSRVQGFANIPMELQGSIQDSRVGFRLGGAAYNIKSFVSRFCFANVYFCNVFLQCVFAICFCYFFYIFCFIF